MKICVKCKKEKSMECFNNYRRSDDGRFYECKQCGKERNEQYRQKNKQKISEYNKKYTKRYYEQNKDEINKNHKNDYELFKERWKRTRKNYYEKNKNRLLSIQKERLKNPIVKKQRLLVSAKRDRERRLTDPNYRIKKTLRTRIWNALKGLYKTKTTEELLGCKIQELKEYLESKFLGGMSWDNYGKWHIDHIKPCSLFNLAISEEQQKCFHYTNLQPLWAYDNLTKNDKFI